MDKVLEINGNKLGFSETGQPSGEPLVLLHGWGCDRSTLRSIAKIAEQSMRVISVDFPGHGKSPEPNEVWGVDDYTKQIEELLRLLEIKKPILLGHSFGGRVAILYSSRNETSKVILVDAAGIKPRHSLKYILKVRSFKLFKKLAPIVLGEKSGNRMIEEWRNRAGSSDYSKASPKMRAILSKVVNEDLKACLPLIKCPVLLIWGENDTATPIKDARLMEARIPDAGLVSFPGCGHYSFLDNPVGFRAVFKEFLKSELNK